MEDVDWLTPDQIEDWRALMALTLALPAALDSQLQRDSGVTRFEYQVMSALSESPGRSLPMSVLAALASGSMSRVSHAVSRLEAAGWLERRASTLEGCRTEAHLTEAGWEKVVQTAPGHVREARRVVVDVLGPDELRALGDAARKIVATADPRMVARFALSSRASTDSAEKPGEQAEFPPRRGCVRRGVTRATYAREYMNTQNMAAWRPSVVALDIDGTLVDHEGALPEQVRRSVRRVVAAGVPVVLTTGRSWHSTRPVFEELGLPAGPAVASNGAVTVTFPPFGLEQVRTFNPAQVIARVLREHPTAAIAAEVIGQGYRVTRQFPDGDLTGHIEEVSVDDLAGSDVTRIVVRDPHATDIEFIALAERIGLHGVSYSVGWSAWLDIAPEGVNKASALVDVVAGLGCTARDVLAIGDGRNDIEMLTWAGRGVAIGDACDEVKAAADAVTGTFADGGAAHELDRWFRLQRASSRPRELSAMAS
jgi:Cof subfamily protein (haloacid dehalogenase superfamily)